jgi:hypothetical protein
MHRLSVEVRRQAFSFRSLAAEGEHVLRNVASVNVQTSPEVRDEQAAGAVGDVESRLTARLKNCRK